MLYQLSYFRKNRPYQSYPFPHTVSRRRRACNSNRHSFLWEVMDSNHRRRTPADLQSAPFGHSGNFPCFAPLPRGIRFARLSRRNWLVSLGCALFHFADPALGRLSFYRRPAAASVTKALVPSELPASENTFVCVKQVCDRQTLFRLLPLTAGFVTSVRFPRVGFPSRWRDSNPRPADYKSAALAN